MFVWIILYSIARCDSVWPGPVRWPSRSRSLVPCIRMYTCVRCGAAASIHPSLAASSSLFHFPRYILLSIPLSLQSHSLSISLSIYLSISLFLSFEHFLPLFLFSIVSLYQTPSPQGAVLSFLNISTGLSPNPNETPSPVYQRSVFAARAAIKLIANPHSREDGGWRVKLPPPCFIGRVAQRPNPDLDNSRPLRQTRPLFYRGLVLSFKTKNSGLC